MTTSLTSEVKILCYDIDSPHPQPPMLYPMYRQKTFIPIKKAVL